MAGVNIGIPGVSKLRRTGVGEFNSDDHYIYYWGEESLRRNGIAIIVNKRVWNAALGCNPQNHRMISFHFQGKAFNIMVIQVYAPTSNTEEAEVEPFTPFRTNTSKNVLFIIGKWNAKVRSQDTWSNRQIWTWSTEWSRLIEFCQENTPAIANTLVQQHKKRLYTWTSPEGQHWNQIDYIFCSQRWRSSIQSAKTRLGADCGWDHELLIVKFRLK